MHQSLLAEIFAIVLQSLSVSELHFCIAFSSRWNKSMTNLLKLKDFLGPILSEYLIVRLHVSFTWQMISIQTKLALSKYFLHTSATSIENYHATDLKFEIKGLC